MGNKSGILVSMRLFVYPRLTHYEARDLMQTVRYRQSRLTRRAISSFIRPERDGVLAVRVDHACAAVYYRSYSFLCGDAKDESVFSRRHTADTLGSFGLADI